MPFREKKAWITLITLILVTTLFIVFMDFTYRDSTSGIFRIGHLLLAAVITFIVVEVGLILLARWQTGEEARMPKDEREVLIDLKATRIAYVTLIVLMLLVALTMSVLGGDTLAWGLHFLLAISLAEMTRAATQILLFRRDA